MAGQAHSRRGEKKSRLSFPKFVRQSLLLRITGVILALLVVGSWFGNGNRETWPAELDNLENVKLRVSEDGTYPTVAHLIQDIVPGEKGLLDDENQIITAKNIAHGLKIWVAPINNQTLMCLKSPSGCGNNHAAWDKRVYLFLLELMADVKPEEADFVFIPNFHFCFRNNRGCYGTIGRRPADEADSLYLIYKETLETLERLAPGRDWTNRFVVPMSHERGGCGKFDDSYEHGSQRHPVLKDQIAISTFGNVDGNCYLPQLDVVIPPFMDYEAVKWAEKPPASEHREYLLINLSTQSSGHVDKVVNLMDRFAQQGCPGHPDKCIFKPIGDLNSQEYVDYLRCIPVLLMDDGQLPFQDFLDYRKFAITLNTRGVFIDNLDLEALLTSIDRIGAKALQVNGGRVRRSFDYRAPFARAMGPYGLLLETLKKRKQQLGF
ncbi:hypothetical protein NDN08_000605 [Rhodosorus marinus]|uniref:Exostosin GT47 domain-containing protein n=1 Tax=Rhodosorus marinus TaxID=101924 RepID=A0AAV8UU42_9RHOD|nr:hypothetical protein NDN08_000605 [Rhodosorus marinus]